VAVLRPNQASSGWSDSLAIIRRLVGQRRAIAKGVAGNRKVAFTHAEGSEWLTSTC